MKTGFKGGFKGAFRKTLCCKYPCHALQKCVSRYRQVCNSRENAK